LHAEERQWIRVAIPRSRRHRAHRPAAPHRGHALHDEPGGLHAARGRRPVQRWLEALAGLRRGRQAGVGLQSHAQRDGESRLRSGRGGSGGSEPERRGDVLQREASVLRRRLVDLEFRIRWPAQLLGVQLVRAELLKKFGPDQLNPQKLRWPPNPKFKIDEPSTKNGRFSLKNVSTSLRFTTAGSTST